MKRIFQSFTDLTNSQKINSMSVQIKLLTYPPKGDRYP